MIDKELLEILACPACKSAVKEEASSDSRAVSSPSAGIGHSGTRQVEEGDRIVCTNPSCGLRYPVREGIPVMLVDEAEKPKR